MTEFSQDSFNTFMSQCSMSDDVTAAKELLDRGDVDVTAKNWQGESALHYAVFGGCKNVSAWLIKLGLDKDLKDNNGKSSVDIAKKNGKDLSDWDSVFAGTWGPSEPAEGPTIVSLGEAAAFIFANASALSASEGADAGEYEVDSEELFKFINSLGKDEAFEKSKELLSAGGDPKVRNWKNDTPLHWCGTYDRENVAQLLIDNGADVNAQNDDGETPLYKAAMSASLATVKVLITWGANRSLKGKKGTPLEALKSESYWETEACKAARPEWEFYLSE